MKLSSMSCIDDVLDDVLDVVLDVVLDESTVGNVTPNIPSAVEDDVVSAEDVDEVVVCELVVCEVVVEGGGGATEDVVAVNVLFDTSRGSSRGKALIWSSSDGKGAACANVLRLLIAMTATAAAHAADVVLMMEC